MSATDSPTLLVARFLKSNHYDQTLEAFLSEAGLSEDASTTKPDDWTLEQILEEKRQFDSSLNFEKTNDDGDKSWRQPAPTKPTSPTLPNSSNVLFVTANSAADKILTTHADKSLNQILAQPPYTFHDNELGNDSPILSVQRLQDQFMLTTSMSGQLALRDANTGAVIAKRRDHLKMAVQVAAANLGQDVIIIATAGWDQKVLVYVVDPTRAESADSSEDDSDFFGDPIHIISLSTVPESLLFVRNPDTDDLYLILSRRDSSFLYYYKVAAPPGTAPTSHILIQDSGRQNLAPHSNAWVAFTPSCLRSCPRDPALIAVATSHLPHMKLIIVRLLFPSPTLSGPSSQHRTPASAARADLALQDREDAAISLLVTTMSPQTPYSTPQVVWRPDASGVWVNGDDGVIRGVEVKTGKVVSLLKGHEVASKVRTLWAGNLKDEDGEEREVLVSGGFDKQVLIWDCEANTPE